MAVITIIKEIKKIHPKEVVMVKIGDFYHVYGKDSYILAFLLGYKLKNIEDNCMTCGFPTKSLAKVEAMLENKKVNYILLDRRNNYDVDEFSDNKNLNTYDEQFEKANRYIKAKNRIDIIYFELMKNINDKDIKNKLYEIETILHINA